MEQGVELYDLYEGRNFPDELSHSEKPTPRFSTLHVTEQQDLKYRRTGRKLLFRTFMLKEGYKLGVCGLSMSEIADFWNVGREVLFRWAKKFPDFKAEIERGKMHSDSLVINALFRAAEQGNVTAMIFWLKNRQKKNWKDRWEIEGKGFEGDTHYHIERQVIFTDDPAEARGENSRLHAFANPEDPPG